MRKMMMKTMRMMTMLKVSWQLRLTGVVWMIDPLSFLNLANVCLHSSFELVYSS